MSKFGKFFALAALGSMAAGGTAQAACWSPAAVEAAKVRDLQSRLMVAALRCGKSSHDLLPEYNRFVKTKKSVLQHGNRLLLAHFSQGKSKKMGLRAYDRYAVSLANRYGAGSGDLSECRAMKLIAAQAANGEARQSALVALAQSHALAPELPGGRCGIVIAAKD